MAKKRKLTSGEGWSLEPAGSASGGPTASKAPGEQTIKITCQKRQKGKIVTLAEGFSLTPADLKALGKTLKNTCGAGGTAREGTIEIQGDHIQTITDRLEAAGYRVR